MNDNNSGVSLDGSILPYVTQFRIHQEFVQGHLKGALNDKEPLLPAFFPPSSYWTSDEKNLFFRGLAVYSRLRPDLIAESIKTKSTLDVCLYLDILQTAASSNIPSHLHGSFRSSLEPAMEVSGLWIQNEEKMAEALIQVDSCTCIPGSADGETYPPVEGLSNSESPVIASSIMVTPKEPNHSKAEAQQLRKRLYMRRKRAQSAGKSINVEAIRLHPGRQPRNRKDSQPVPNDNPDFFYMSSLVRLTRLFSSLNDSTRPSHEVSISADTIQFLIAIITEFISEVVRDSLVSKEQEKRLKGNLKVWRYDQEEITGDNVRETLKFMRINHMKAKDYLSKLVGGSDGISPPDRITTGIRTEDDDTGGARGEGNNQDNNDYKTSNVDTTIDPTRASDTYEQSPEPSQPPTEFWLPESSSQPLLPKDIRLSENDGDFSLEVDEIELQRELEEEEELDAQDLLASKDFEAGLWGSES